MKMITCPRCGASAPRFSSRNNKVWGGRICANCSKEMKAKMGRAIPQITKALRNAPPRAINETKHRAGETMLSRVTNKLLRVFGRKGRG